MKTYFKLSIVILFFSFSFFSCVLKDDEPGELIYQIENKLEDDIVRLVRFTHDGIDVKWDSINLNTIKIHDQEVDYYVNVDFNIYNTLYDSIHIHYKDEYLVRHYPDNQNNLNRCIYKTEPWEFSKETVNHHSRDRLYYYEITNDDFEEAKVKGVKY